MPETVNLTIRIADDLKTTIEGAASLSGQTTTEYLLHAARLRMAGACVTCGRDVSGPPTVLPGMTTRFEEWCQRVLKDRGGGMSPRVVFATNEPDARRVYTGTFDKQCVHDSYVTLFMEIDREHRHIIPVPRAYLVMWEEQDSGDWLKQRLVTYGGYVDVFAFFEKQAKVSQKNIIR